MNDLLHGRTCVVGIGESAYGKRGTLFDVGSQRLAVDAIRAACDDAGLRTAELDGFCSWSDDPNAPWALAPALGVTQWSYAGFSWGGGGSALPTAVTNAAMAVTTGVCKYAVVVRSISAGDRRLGSAFASRATVAPLPLTASYSVPFGFSVPMALYAMRARRHMAVYGTTDDHLAAVAVTQRAYASRNPLAVYREPMTIEDHHASNLVVDPLRVLDCCMESDGATAFVITTEERARDLRQHPVKISGVATRTDRRWTSPAWYTESDEGLASSGHRAAAEQLYTSTGIGPDDVDVAFFYDGATIGVILGLEDWMFVERGYGGPFVAASETALDGALPVNTSGGNLSECYTQGASHLVEAVRQLRGDSHNQVEGAEIALYASGQGYPPMGGVLLKR